MASVLERMEQAESILAEIAAELEPGTLDVAGAKELVDRGTRCSRYSSVIVGRAARRVEDAVTWKKSGHRSAAHWLASTTGVSVGAATRSLHTARELEGLPETADAFRSGELSEAQAAEIAVTASLDPRSEHRLLERVRSSSSFKGLRDECREVAAHAVGDDRAAARRLYETRALHTWTERDGHWRMDVRLAPADGAWLNRALADMTDEIFRAARTAGRMEPRAAYMADALVALVDKGPSKPPEVRSSITHEALARGYLEPGEHSELEGVGPVPVTVVRGLLDDARLTLLAHDGTEISHISSPKRTIPAALRRWLEQTYPVCGNEGCSNDQRLQIDHIIPVEEHGPTSKDNCWRLCSHHHDLKTYAGWQVVGPPGKRKLVPP